MQSCRQPMKHPIGSPRESRDNEVFSLAILQHYGEITCVEKIVACRSKIIGYYHLREPVDKIKAK